MAVGNTIASERLGIYINAIQPMARAFDGFFLQDFTAGKRLSLSSGIETPAGVLRTDVNAPVIVLNTATAAVGRGEPMPEGAKLRIWTPAGSSHTTGPYMARVAQANLRDMGMDAGFCPVEYANTMPVQYISGAAIVALDRWIKTGKPAPSFPQLKVIGTGKDAVTPFDAQGNSIGGLRSPWVDAPIARYDWRGECTGGSGRTFPLTAEQLKALYGDPATYRRKFAAAVADAQRRGVILPQDVQAALREADKVTW